MRKILVLLATYNGERYLPEQIDSLLCQKNVNISILVRDDGSTDGTQEMLEKYQAEGKLRWYTGAHKNVQKSFFDLMRKAAQMDADYYAFCDQDDVWEEDKLSIAAQRLDEVEPGKPALYYCGQRLVDGELNFLSNHILNQHRSLQTRFVLSDFAGCTGVFNKALLEEVVKYEPDYLLMHDTWILKVCLCLGGTVVVDPQPHMSYRQHGGNTVGLGRSLRAYCTQVKRYLFEYKVEAQMRELARGYGDRMVSPYREICQWVCGYRENKAYRKNLLDKTNVDFCAFGLNVTYRLKVILRML